MACQSMRLYVYLFKAERTFALATQPEVWRKGERSHRKQLQQEVLQQQSLPNREQDRTAPPRVLM